METFKLNPVGYPLNPEYRDELQEYLDWAELCIDFCYVTECARRDNLWTASNLYTLDYKS